jgi:hypothetical protein
MLTERLDLSVTQTKPLNAAVRILAQSSKASNPAGESRSALVALQRSV